MGNSKLYRALKKTEFDPEFTHRVLHMFKENEWFKPHGADSFDPFSVCDNLHHKNLICKKIVPKYIDGQFKGNSVYFLYKENLDYEGI